MRISLLPLNELYERPKITASVEAAIQSKEAFNSVSQLYCEKVCKLKCKNTKDVRLLNIPVDILIVQDHMAPDGKWDRRPGQQEQTMESITALLGKEAGFAGLTVRTTSLLKCKPNATDFPRGKAPTATTLMKCKPYLHAEIEMCKPKVIISLSTAVTKALGLKKHSNTGNRGEIVQASFGQVVITVHPRVLTMIRQNSSGVFWGGDYYDIIRKDFEKAAKLVRGTLIVPNLLDSIKFYAEKRIFIAKSIDDVKQILSDIESLPSTALVSFDTETTSLNPMLPHAKLLCIQFGWRDPETKEIIAAVIPLWHRENISFNADEAWSLVVPLLTGPRGKIAHNGKFDILYIYHTTGVRVRNLMFDTMLVLHSIDSGTQGCYGLKTAVTDYLPHTGLSGYENLLPKLTKPPKVKTDEVEIDPETGEPVEKEEVTEENDDEH